MNGILKCAYPSYRLEQFKKKISASRENSNVAFSSILSKSALQYSSYRYSIQLKNKFSINKSYLHLLDELLLHLIFSDQMKVCSPYLKHYHIKFTDIDVMAKLHRFCDQGPNYRKMMTTGRKNSLKKWFKSE